MLVKGASYTYDANGNRTLAQTQDYDHFDSGLGAWTPGTTWVIENGELSTAGISNQLKSVAAYGYTDFSARIDMISGNDVSLIFRAADDANYYYARCSGFDPGGPKLVLYKVTHNVHSLVASTAVIGAQAGANQWYTLHVTADGGTIHCDYNYNNGAGTASLTYTDTSPLLNGEVGFRAIPGHFHFDDVALTTRSGYVYDAASQLTQFTGPDGNTASYTYDGSGNRLTFLSNLWQDSFTAGSIDPSWAQLCGSWSIDSLNRLKGASTSTEADIMRGAALTNAGGFTFQSGIKMSAGTDVGLAFDIQNSGADMYVIRASGYADDKDSGDNSAKTALWKKVGGSWTKLTSGAGARMIDSNGAALVPQAGSWYTLKVTVKGSTISWCYQVNGVWSIGYVMTDSTFNSGTVGLRVGLGGGANTDFFTNTQVLNNTSYSYDAANQLTQITDQSGNVTALGYDAAGNNTSEGAIIRTYDERNRLTSVTSGGATVSYTYDGLGRLQSRSANSATTTYRYNDVTGALMDELDSTGAVKVSYISDTKGNPISVRRTVNGSLQNFFYHTNAHGDVVAITDSSGNTVASFTYDAWGNPTEYDAPNPQTAVVVGSWAGSGGQGLFFLFGSMLYDAATGLYLTKTRAYNPKTGRFLQRDILDESGKNGVYKGFPFGKDAIGTNLYAWCGNNPVTRVDPSGNSWLTDLIRGAARAVTHLAQVASYVTQVAQNVSTAVRRSVASTYKAVKAAAQKTAAVAKAVLQPQAPSREAVINTLNNWNTPQVAPLKHGVVPADLIQQDDELKESRAIGGYAHWYEEVEGGILGPGLLVTGPYVAVGGSAALEIGCTTAGGPVGTAGCATAVPGIFAGGFALSYAGWKMMEVNPVWAPVTRKIGSWFD